jgi:hypothetical protein
MMRVAALIICACWIASYSGAASSAQSVTLPKCDYKAVDAQLAAGAIPDMKGCDYPVIAKILEARHRRGVTEYDPAVTGIRRDVITAQNNNDGIAFLSLSTGAGYPPPPPHHPTFSIKAPDHVREGEPISITIHQEDSDGQAHRVGLTYDHPELLADPQSSVDFSAGKTDRGLPVYTASGKAGDGDKTIKIGLQAPDEGTIVGDPGSATVKIVDTQPTTYRIVPPGNIVRGDPVTFRIDKSGPLTPSRLDFDVRQEKGRISPDGMPHPLVFGAGEPSQTLTLTPDFYDKCGPPPTLDLDDGSGQPNSATATFKGTCPLTLLQRLNRAAPWWPLAAIPVAASLGYGLWRLARRIFNGKNGNNGGNDDEVTPTPDLYPTWKLEDGAMSPLPDPPGIPGWPKFTSEVRIDWGGAQVPDPLPIAEPNDG